MSFYEFHNISQVTVPNTKSRRASKEQQEIELNKNNLKKKKKLNFELKPT